MSTPVLIAATLTASLLTTPPAVARDDSEGKRASRAAARVMFERSDILTFHCYEGRRGLEDSIAGIGRWNKVIEKAGLSFRLQAPHKAFNRHIGTFAGIRVSPDGRVISEAEWAANVRNWLPSEEDRAYVASLMGRVVEPGKMANWIAPPPVGINRQPVDFDYVRFN